VVLVLVLLLLLLLWRGFAAAAQLLCSACSSLLRLVARQAGSFPAFLPDTTPQAMRCALNCVGFQGQISMQCIRCPTPVLTSCFTVAPAVPYLQAGLGTKAART
jgi:hypothetical protein